MDMDFQNGMKKIFDEVIDGIKSGTEGFLNEEEKKLPNQKKFLRNPEKILYVPMRVYRILAVKTQNMLLITLRKYSKLSTTNTLKMTIS